LIKKYFSLNFPPPPLYNTELFGFDILIDETFKPWVLEVNLSPSLDCDALLDVRIKSTMVSDLLTLTGVHCQNPNIYSNRSRQREQQFKSKTEAKLKLRPHSAHASAAANNAPSKATNPHSDPFYDGLSQAEQHILKTVVDEGERANGWVRLFPTADTWEFYSQFLETRSTSYNVMLHKKLYPRRYIITNTWLDCFSFFLIYGFFRWQGGNVPKKATQVRAK
jgi:tubulin polyglutamylase TTLL5